MSEKHILLGREECKGRFADPLYKDHFSRVYEPAVASKVFGSLLRHSMFSDTPRTAESLGFSEINRQGQIEQAISVTNLRARLLAPEGEPQITDINQVNLKVAKACFELAMTYFPEDEELETHYTAFLAPEQQIPQP